MCGSQWCCSNSFLSFIFSLKFQVRCLKNMAHTPPTGSAIKKETLNSCLYLANRSTKFHEILIEHTFIRSKYCAENSERLVSPNSLTNHLHKKCEFSVFREDVPDVDCL